MSDYSVINRGIYEIKFYTPDSTEWRYIVADSHVEAMKAVKSYAENMYGDITIIGIEMLYDCLIISHDMITNLCGRLSWNNRKIYSS